MMNQHSDPDDLLVELRKTLQLEPSEEFEARVRARVQHDARHQRSPWMMATLVAAAGVFALAAGLTWLPRSSVAHSGMMATRQVSAPAVQPLAVLRTTSPADLPAPAAVSIRLPRGTGRSAMHRASARLIVVPEGQAAGVRQLARAAALGLVRFPAPVAPPTDDDGIAVPPLPALDPIRVVPIDIEPLAN